VQKKLVKPAAINVCRKTDVNECNRLWELKDPVNATSSRLRVFLPIFFSL